MNEQTKTETTVEQTPEQQRLEIKTEMAQLQKRYSTLAAEVKELDIAHNREANRTRFSEYVYKIGVHGTLYPQEQIRDVEPQDYDNVIIGNSGLLYTQAEPIKGQEQGFAFLMMKSLEEYPRYKLLFERLEAARIVKDKDAKIEDKEKAYKTLLGET